MQSRKNILIIEDEESIRETLRFALELEGFQVFVAANGKEGLETLERIPGPCLILLDLMMPIMNGWEFAKAVKKDSVLATIPIVIVSAFADRSDSIGAEGIIKKPVDLDILLRMVRQHCN